ncbi:MAG TPA: exo-beta-N-acetylmuramidase NamZ domain-containing protein [Blastocatellia bacterium]|nr:exo-beta-N-acetylmuramidase NamZ domain-containing protein [Blastocatellia bacterium]
MKRWVSGVGRVLLIVLLYQPVQPAAQRPKAGELTFAPPAAVGMSAERLSEIDHVVQEAISRKELPGAVIAVGRRGRIVYRKALGSRAVEPERVPMTVDTIFDLASLTKVVATATSVLILVERGKVRLGDPVARYIPEFGQNGKQRITVEQLLIHRGGLIADNDLDDYRDGPVEAMKRIYQLAPIVEPGTRFIYSDVGYIVLGELVRRVSGQPLDVFASENIFRPLGMKDTMFRPDELRRQRCAPTERREGRWMIGEVHDPRAYALGGVAGHAGLFSTADDLAIYAQMILNGGEFQGVRILSPLGVRRMTESRGLPLNEMRGLGWDINTGYSSNRGDLFPLGSFGHTGFTGTSLWIDPGSQTFVIFLSNRVHPDGRGDVTSLRGRVASIVAAAIVAPPLPAWERPASPAIPSDSMPTRASAPAVSTVLTGIDVLRQEAFARLAGRRIGLITNHTGRARDGTSTIDLLAGAKGLTLVALFSPEHGIRGHADEPVGDARDEKTGLPIYSLYGERRRPTEETLKGIDTLVFDIQDIGARFYTYITTMGYAMEEAARRRIRFVVLDRPNPINGVDVEGPLADADSLSFTAYHSIPIRHGMTVGELAQLFNEERKIGVELDIVRIEGWRRDQWFDATSLEWINPSPNMRSMNAAALYPGIGLLETTNLSVGRGTERPFEQIGAPWLDGKRLAFELNQKSIPGVRFIPIRFTPRASKFAGEECGGIMIVITDRSALRPVRLGIEIAVALRKLFRESWRAEDFGRLLANRRALELLLQGADADQIERSWQSSLEEFRRLRRKYLLYN